MSADLKTKKNADARLHSSFIIRHSSFPPAYTLVELFLTIAVLMIVLGLMVNLANRVRRDSADRLTRQMLQHLAALMDNYIATNGGIVPEVTPLIDSAPVDEMALLKIATQNDMEFIKYLNLPESLTSKGIKSDALLHNLRKIGPNQMVLEDAWGSPIVFMPRQDPAVGMAPEDHPFFFSAGPDRVFLTVEDNLYSYEEGGNAER